MRNFTFDLDYFRYYKDKSEGGIFDFEAMRNHHGIGGEIDIAVSCRKLRGILPKIEEIERI